MLFFDCQNNTIAILRHLLFYYFHFFFFFQNAKTVDTSNQALEKLAALQKENDDLSKQLQQIHESLLAVTKESESENSELRTRLVILL